MEDINRQEAIHEKGFKFGKMDILGQKIKDTSVDINAFDQGKTRFTDKETIVKALTEQNSEQLKLISEYYYATNGIYQRFCKYLAYLYKYDWYLTTKFKKDKEKIKENAKAKALKDFDVISDFLDKSNIKKMLGNFALEVVKEGCYYGYDVSTDDRLIIQDLPSKYCRSRFFYEGEPAVEFNMKYFDDTFKDGAYRLKILKSFPKDFQKGYVLYKDGKLKAEYAGDRDGWYLLDPTKAFKFNFNNCDVPIFTNVIPSLIDLDSAQTLDRKKMAQQLAKIIVQKLPLDKNGELIFDIDEARDIHNNAVQMLKGLIGIDVLTTFADIEVANTADKSTSTSIDDLEKVERSVFNSAGISNNLFNTSGNVSLDRSILNDEASIRDLILQFNQFLNRIIDMHFNKNKDYAFRIKILETTAYNYKDLSKMYKEQVQIGYSKMLPQVALGHSQSEIIDSLYFENEILDLTSVMIPPMSSNTMNAEALGKQGEKKSGRKQLEESEKTDKTLANIEAMGGQEHE